MVVRFSKIFRAELDPQGHPVTYARPAVEKDLLRVI